MENHNNILDSKLDQKQKEFVWGYLRDNDLVSFGEDIISAPKAFVINSVVRWSFIQIQNKNMSPNQWERIRRMISQYVAGIVELEWHKGKIRTIEVKDGVSRRKRK
tara:strand:+ start:432 stop:749 length:318 start_codon:yes stop_codon:yes gene_type:complete